MKTNNQIGTVVIPLHYFVYKTINKINGRFYIGKHITTDMNDGYMGSGVRLLQAMEQCGKENFKRVILFKAKDEEMLNQAEKICIKSALANDKKKKCYNAINGGGGNRKSVKSIIKRERKHLNTLRFYDKDGNLIDTNDMTIKVVAA